MPVRLPKASSEPLKIAVFLLKKITGKKKKKNIKKKRKVGKTAQFCGSAHSPFALELSWLAAGDILGADRVHWGFRFIFFAQNFFEVVGDLEVWETSICLPRAFPSGCIALALSSPFGAI
jgi:hypothetical protein